MFLAASMLLSTSLILSAQNPAGSSPPPNPPQNAAPTQPETLDNTLEAGDDELPTPAHDIVSWNHFDTKLTTFRFGAGFLYEYASFAQDNASKEQIRMFANPRIRDSRVVFKGRLKTDREISWSVGILYDSPTKKFLFRQTQIMIDVPKIWGDIVIGRTKEGVSLNKVMIGYAGWTMERAPISDAAIPILADGVKWQGYIPEKHLLWNLGFYKDWVSEGQTFSTYAHQYDARVVWLPIESDERETVLHIGLNYRYGKPDDEQIQFRSRPEAFPAPFFVDTGKFPARNTNLVGPEVYYRPRSLLVGGEYYAVKVRSEQENNPLFHGGEVFVSWLPTGEVRIYNTRGGFFEQISPKRSVYQGGPGAWELVANFSYIDLDSGGVKGGKFWRFTPTVNWHMSDNIRLEFAYGYGSLNRFDLVGKTQFFQTRIQLVF